MENHPREETEQQRQYERKRLRSWLDRKLTRYGMEGLSVPFIHVIDAPLKFSDERVGHMHKFTYVRDGRTKEVIKLNVYHSSDLMGPFTKYTSKSPGEFTRSDINPLDSGALSEDKIQLLSDSEKIEALLVGSALAAQSKLIDAEEGVDEFPISAHEARDVYNLVRTAQIAF